MGKDKAAVMTVQEAVEHLSDMAEIDVDEAEGGTEKSRLFSYQWMNPDDERGTLDTVRSTFKTIHNYIKTLNTKELKNLDTQKGVHSIMVLAGEAAEKMDKCRSLFRNTLRSKKFSELEEYKNLREYYLSKIFQRFVSSMKEEEQWEEEFGEEVDIFDVQRKGLKDLETVKRDREYEYFYLLDENGQPFYTRNLVRHIRLVRDFDEILSDNLGNDPLVQMRGLQDRLVQSQAQAMKEQTACEIKAFYKEGFQYKSHPFVADVVKITMALFLASNKCNLAQNTTGKTCLDYFRDFQIFIRNLIESREYNDLARQEEVDFPPLYEKGFFLVLHLVRAFFLHDQETKPLLEFLSKLTQKTKLSLDTLAILEEVVEHNEKMRAALKQYPSGPLMKALDFFTDIKHTSFDPLLQGNFPSRLFTIKREGICLTALRLPCPTMQERISKAEITKEFLAFLDGLKIDHKKYLMLNLQDRTSKEAIARCKAVENLSRNAEYAEQFTVVTLAKDTDFYLQKGEYLNRNDSADFCHLLVQQIREGENCGFFFPKKLLPKIDAFLDPAVKAIFQTFFRKASTLSRANRLVFIEIFYSFLILKCLELSECNLWSLTCKDSLDVGAVSMGGYFAFLHFLTNTKWDRKRVDFFRYLCLAPALQHRERVVHMHRLSRQVSALSKIAERLNLAKPADLNALFILFDHPWTQCKIHLPQPDDKGDWLE